MTVVLQKDGRIRVDDSHDALLLSLAGVELRDSVSGASVFFNQECQEWDSKLDGEFAAKSYLPLPLYVPADVAKELTATYKVFNDFNWWWTLGLDAKEGSIQEFTYDEDIIGCYMRRHNNRWNLLPDIVKE